MQHDSSIPSADAVATLFRTAEERGADGAAAFFAAGFIALAESCFRAPGAASERTAFVVAALEGLVHCSFRDRLANEPSFSDYRAWLDVAAPPPPDIVEGFVRVLSRTFGPPHRPVSPKVTFAVFRQSFSRRDRILRLMGAAAGVARALACSWRHPVAALRLARDLVSAARSRLFDRDFYAWAYPNVTARRFASPLLHYCTQGWREGRRFSPAFPALPPDTVPPRENPLLLHARLFPGRQPTAYTVRRLVRELRPDGWTETVRGRLRAEAAAKPPIAVVIPVYNHPELLPPLVASLLEHTPPDVLLLFVENGSSDKRVRPMLERLAAACPGRVRIECLDENLGFAGACNHGIRTAGRRDVILLNNDTVVGPRWCDSLRLAAYADSHIGTATAVSDNSGLASVPDRGKNPMPSGRSVGTVARYWLHAPETVFDLHTGHGFCLYLKRAMLDEIGEFDAATFGKGYGEEADLCLRAFERGWKHRITTKAFVWHLNAVSFGGLYKAFKVHVARHTLLERHPALDLLEAENIPRWSAFSPWLRSLADGFRANAPRPRVLFFPDCPVSLFGALRTSFEPFLLVRAADGSAELFDSSVQAVRENGPRGTVVECGAGTDDDIVSWILEHGIEAVFARNPASIPARLSVRLAALHISVLHDAALLSESNPARSAARLGAIIATAISNAPQMFPTGIFAAEEKTCDLILTPVAAPGGIDPVSFDRMDISGVCEIVVDRLPLPVSDDVRLLLLARLCGARIRIRAKTEDPLFWTGRAMPHFWLFAAADAIEKPNRPPLDAEFLPFFPQPPPPPPPDVLAGRTDAYLRAKASRSSPARHIVYTAIAGGYDTLKMPDAPDSEVDYVYFAPGPVKYEGPWTFRPFKWTSEDPTRTARWHKLHAPNLFPDAETVVWIDGNIVLLPGVEREIREKLLASRNPIATLRHFDRHNVWEEAEACIERGKDAPALLRAQIARYRAAGLPEEHPFAETCIVACRPGDLRARNIFSIWWEELSSGSRRDQISLPFALWKNEADYTQLFDRDIRLAVDKVRFLGHDLHRRKKDAQDVEMKQPLLGRLPFFRKRRNPQKPIEAAFPPRRSLQELPGRNGNGAFSPPSGDAPLVFSHSGKIGDLVFSLPFCRAVAKATGHDDFAFHIRTGTIIDRLRSDGAIVHSRLLDTAGAELLRPLLERQPYISRVSESPETPAGAIDLDFFRVQTCLPLWGNSIPNYYLPLAPWLTEAPDLSHPWLSGGRKIDLGKRRIVLFLSSRYPREGLSFGFLKPYRDELLFLGTDEEHKAFASAWFPVEHRPIRDLADALDVFSSVRLAIGNQTGFYAIAEALKIPRLLVVSPASPNVIPCGGAFQLLHETESARTTFLAFRERFCR